MYKSGPTDNFLELRKIGLGGLNVLDDPADIGDSDLAEAVNIVFDSGVAAPRAGSVLWADKPDGENQDALQTMVFNTSDGLEYVVAVYGNNFYLRDESAERWVKINSTYTPAETTLFYGYVSWNNGRGDDRGYFCNGTDNFARWEITLDSLASDHSAGAPTVTLVDGTRFPSGGGTLVITDGVTTEYAAYSSRTGNVFTLSGTLANSFATGSSVSMMMVEKPDMEKGRYLARWQRRLITANRYGGETNFYFSKVDDPEEFMPGNNTNDAGFFQLSDGNGGITGVYDFGEFLLVTKSESLHRFEFQLNVDLDTKLERVTPIISGASMGPIDGYNTIKVLNSLYYPTQANGFIRLDPAQTGSNTSTKVDVISRKIHPLAKRLNYSNGRVAHADQKIFWVVAEEQSNNVIVMYDLLRQAWTTFDSWLAQDLFALGDDIYYLSRINGKIYKGLTGQNDAGQPFVASLTLKRLNFGKSPLPKTADALYIEGYMTDATEFFVDVYYNELGRLRTVTYQINSDTPGLYFSPVSLNALGQYPAGLVPLGLIPDNQIGQIGVFRAYLSIPNGSAFYNIQVRLYSMSENARWTPTCLALNPDLSAAIPSLMRISPIT